METVSPVNIYCARYGDGDANRNPDTPIGWDRREKAQQPQTGEHKDNANRYPQEAVERAEAIDQAVDDTEWIDAGCRSAATGRMRIHDDGARDVARRVFSPHLGSATLRVLYMGFWHHHNRVGGPGDYADAMRSLFRCYSGHRFRRAAKQALTQPAQVRCRRWTGEGWRYCLRLST